MDSIIRQIMSFLEQGIEAILWLIRTAWTWSFGEIVAILRSDWQSLPAWKIAVLAIVIVAIAFVLYKAARELWAAIQAIIKSFVALLSAFIAVLPYIIAAGAIAFAGGFVLKNVSF